MSRLKTVLSDSLTGIGLLLINPDLRILNKLLREQLCFAHCNSHQVPPMAATRCYNYKPHLSQWNGIPCLHGPLQPPTKTWKSLGTIWFRTRDCKFSFSEAKTVMARKSKSPSFNKPSCNPWGDFHRFSLDIASQQSKLCKHGKRGCNWY